MKKLGVLFVKTKSKLLIVKPVVIKPARLVGAEVYNSNMKKIGLIVDVIGRVNNPYVVVKPDSSDIVDYLDAGSTLYYYIRSRKSEKTPGRRAGRKK